MNDPRWLTLLQTIIAAAAFAMLSHCFSAGPVASDEARSELILSNLPIKDGPAYKELEELAGHPEIEILDMTKSEMWRVRKSLVENTLTAAAQRGVTVIQLDQNWNRMLTPYPTTPTLTDAQTELKRKTMASKAAVAGSMMALPNPAVLEYALTKGMNSPQPGSASTLFTPLNEKTSVTARRTSVRKTEDGYIWHGAILETGAPVTLIWRVNGGLTGSITYAGHMFAVKPMGGNMQGVVEMEPKMLPPEHQPMDPEMMRKMNMHDDPLVKQGDASMVPLPIGRKTQGDLKNLRDAPLSKKAAEANRFPSTPELASKPGDVAITLIVAYTKKAASHYNDIVNDLIALAIEETNESFRNSGIENVHVKLVYAYMTDYVETGSHFDHLYRFVYDHDGYMDEIHALKTKYHANIAILVVDDPNGCGLSAQVAGPPDKAFAVVHHECAAVEYSLAHEIGHIIGARHDLAEDDSKTPFPFGHGFIDSKNNWRDIMSYAESCGGCPRLPVWSNPDIMINGERVGDELRNNAKVIRERVSIVAGYQ
jgi:peptidyl-Asp metalloendopeptidase